MSTEGPQTLLEAVRHFTDLNVCHEYMIGSASDHLPPSAVSPLSQAGAGL